jgi:hypothetical protein
VCQEVKDSNGSKIPRYVYVSTDFISIKKSRIERNKAHGIRLGVIPQFFFVTMNLFLDGLTAFKQLSEKYHRMPMIPWCPHNELVNKTVHCS